MLIDFTPEALEVIAALPKTQRKALKGQLATSPESVARFLERRGFELFIRPCGCCFGEPHGSVRPKGERPKGQGGTHG